MNTSQFKELLFRMKLEELKEIQNWLDNEILTRQHIILESKTPFEDHGDEYIEGYY